MVHILVDGDCESKEKTFKCEKCGCIFKTDTYSKDFETLEDPNVVYKSNCPRCLSQSIEIHNDL